MKYRDFTTKWSNVNRDSIRVDSGHPLDFYVSKGNKGELRLLFIAGKNYIKVDDSEIIKVKVGLRNDGRYAYSFILMDQRFKNQFFRLCYDLADSSYNCKKNNEAYSYVISLFSKWQKMMKISKGNILSEEEVKGLIAELIVLSELLDSNMGKTTVINGWQGPEGYYQDFVFKDLWYEVKALSKRSDKIIISSIEQLDINEFGRIYVVALDKVELGAQGCITLNEIIKNVETRLADDIILMDKFKDKLTKVGYFYSEEYDNLIYKIDKIRIYNVDDKFPRLKRIEIPVQIGKVKYEIITATIESWLTEERQWN